MDSGSEIINKISFEDFIPDWELWVSYTFIDHNTYYWGIHVRNMKFDKSNVVMTKKSDITFSPSHFTMRCSCLDRKFQKSNPGKHLQCYLFNMKRVRSLDSFIDSYQYYGTFFCGRVLSSIKICDSDFNRKFFIDRSESDCRVFFHKVKDSIDNLQCFHDSSIIIDS
jgi:hypothetical protein